MFADDTVGLMDALNIERAHVLGHSMGGCIAQELVINYPERVEKLILFSTDWQQREKYHQWKNLKSLFHSGF